MNDLKKIVDGGYCIGCGACTWVDDGIRIVLDQYGMYTADISCMSSERLGDVLTVCPFSDHADNEDLIGQRLFGEKCKHDVRLGYYSELYAGYAAKNSFRSKGASGGIVSWLCCQLMDQGLIDYVIHVKPSDSYNGSVLFQYAVSSSIAEVRAGSKSRYYPVEMSEVLRQLKNNEGRYAIVGVSCFIKAVRNLMKLDPIIDERVRFCIGIVCGHLKSTAFAGSYAWEAGISPKDLEEMEFRVKDSGRPANQYSISVSGAGRKVTRAAQKFFCSNWGCNFFRYPACNYCDDVFAETADITIGDAWLEDYLEDSMGTSVIVIRHAGLSKVVSDSCNDGDVVLDKLLPDQLARSQSGGLRDRREGLSYRLFLKDKAKIWVPQKRVPASRKGLGFRRRKIYENRMAIERVSHVKWLKAVNEDSYESFVVGTRGLVKINKALYCSVQQLVVACVKKALQKMLHK